MTLTPCFNKIPCIGRSREFAFQGTYRKINPSCIAFFESRSIRADGLRLAGKYTFQYTKNVRISRSVLNTKDAFWHAKNVTVVDSEIDGEYLGWYSEGLTLIRCHIKGTQPLCYCKNLKLIDCTTENCDLAFEYSGVQADIRGGIDSIKNPRRGVIRADSVGEIIRTSDSVFPSRARIYAGRRTDKK